MTPIRPRSLIVAELADADAMAEATKGMSREDPMVADMLESNERDLVRLQAELIEARSSDLEIRLKVGPSPAIRFRVRTSLAS